MEKNRDCKLMIDPLDDSDTEAFMSEYEKRMTMSKDYDWAGNKVKKSHEESKREKNCKTKKNKKPKEASTTKSSGSKDDIWGKGYDSRSCAYGPGYHSYNGGGGYSSSSSSAYKEGDLVFC